ncbi:hypothetical protein ACE6H2_019267 [Prunus campanulata]
MAAASNGSEYFEIEAGSESFARPSNAESVAEDEDELMWAAIARLPSQKRSNMALLRKKGSDRQGGAKTETVDVRKLDRTNRELVVKKALATTDQDNFLLLSAIKERLDRMTLLLGPPGSGKSTMLLALAGKLDPNLKKSAIGDNTIGHNVLQSHSLPSGDYWYWIGVAVLLLYAVLFNSLVTMALLYLNPLRKAQTVILVDDTEGSPPADGQYSPKFA